MVGKTNKWAIILGGSKGLGLATARKLAESGYNLFVIHRDRKSDLPGISQDFNDIESSGIKLINYNEDAINTQSRVSLIDRIKSELPKGEKVHVLVHSIAKGHLKPMWAKTGIMALESADIQLTVHAMAISLYEWVKDLFDMDMFSDDSRIIAFTSEGNSKALPYYSAVSAAKCALEAIVRSIAVEFASKGIRANCIQAGITDTESFNRIPNSEYLKKSATRRNPNGRLTTPEDVADAVYLLSLDEAKWITGTIITVDGGESLL